MKRILNVEPDRYDAQARAKLETVAHVDKRALDRQDLIDELPGYHALITRLGHQIDHEVLEAGEDLEAVATATTGLDHIDTEAAKDFGIEVLSLRGQSEFLRTIRATPEHTWGLLLALCRRIPQAHTHAVEGGWDRDRFRGTELYRKTLGILGLGRAGRQVARYAQSFDMDVIAHDPYQDTWLDGVDRASSLQGLLAQSDMLSLHVPLNDETRGLIDAEALSTLPDDARLVNTSRGPIIDEDALLEALETGQIAGAALDVVAHERDPEERATGLTTYAAEHTDLILTPHIAGATDESMARTERFIADALAGHLTTPTPMEDQSA